ncbi:MAG: response regulator [Anaerolineae bacterium]|nr:response regulator [Anaerolineae bacterium]
MITTGTNADRVQGFRQIVLDAIEQLCPERDSGFHSKQARSYHILMLRYVEEYTTTDVINQLALSERQFYRDHRKAVQAISQIMRERTTSGLGAVSTPTEAAITVRSETQRVRSQTSLGAVEIDTLLDGAVRATSSLADQYKISISCEFTHGLESMSLEASPAALRQAVIGVITRLTKVASPGGKLQLRRESTEHHYHIGFVLRGNELDAGALRSEFERHDSFHDLLEVLNGEYVIDFVSPNLLKLTLSLPSSEQVILVVDDNPDVSTLFRRYLSDQSVQLRSATDGKEALRLASELQPRIIILDVMLPGQDGWEVLQALKYNPSTSHIPVLVCSVLDAPDLAMSLGADGFLSKPPGRISFLKAMERWQV